MLKTATLATLMIFSFLAFAESGPIRPDVIYGSDDRVDLHQVDDPAVLALAHATVGLVRTQDLSRMGSSYQLITKNYGESYQLCSSEPFREQNTAAFCSGFLVSPDTIVTAGHCIRTQASCQTTSFIFDFALFEKNQNSPSVVDADNVYNCKTLVHSEARGDAADFAVVTLDRSVVRRTPLKLRRAGQPKVSDPLVVIGHPAGLPTKVAGGASVRQLSNGYFIANLDTYGGNSGSAVFSSSGHVEGILVRGEMDFIYRNGCRISNQCADSGCRGEDVTFIKEVLPFLN
jgi:S1-C subfamily serine protease